MLIVGAGFAEPGIVGDVDQKVGPGIDRAAGELSKDGFKAEKNAGPARRCFKKRNRVAGCVLARRGVLKLEYIDTAKGKIFTEGKQVSLVVSPGYAAAVQMIGCIVEAVVACFVFIAGAACYSVRIV